MKILGLVLVGPLVVLLIGAFLLAVISAIKDAIETILYGDSFHRWLLVWAVAVVCFFIGFILLFGE